MIEEYRMQGLTDIVVSTEGEAQVTHTTAYMRTGKVLTYPRSSLDEVGCIAVVLLHTRSNGQYVGVDDDVQGVHAHLLGQDPVGPFSNLYAPFVARGLSLFIEAHHHHGSPIAHYVLGMLDEHLLPFLQGDTVHDTLALHALQSCGNHLPLTGVDHHRHLGNIRLCSNHIQEVHHLGLGIQQTVIHVDVYHKGAILHLLTGDGHSLLVFLLLDESQEFPAARHITAFTHIDERIHGELFQS